MSAVLICSADGCEQLATETLFLRDQIGHTHDCPQDAAVVREWCDVTSSTPIIDGKCQAKTCTGNDYIWLGQPTPLDPKEATHE